MSDESPPETPAATPASEPKRKAPVSKKHTVGRVILISSIVLAMVTGLGVVLASRYLLGNIDHVEIDNKIAERVEKTGPEGTLNVLIMGEDNRDCEGCDIDKESGGGGSDTTILLHLSADRSRAYGVSIPRDSLVTRPDCALDNHVPGGTDQVWNVAFALYGEACTVEQTEATTGIRIDNYIVVNFGGFKSMVDAVDGVPVCIPKDIDDPFAKIFIKAGEREISGDEALDYVRVRHNVGDQSDLGRIKRQQTFMAAMIKKVTSAGVLARPDRLFGFLRAVTGAVQTDFESDDLAKLANQLRSIGMDNIQFVTVPWEYDRRPETEYRILWVEPDATELWNLIDADQPLPEKFTDGSITVDKAPGKETPTTSSSPGPDESSPDESSPTESPSETAPEPSETASPPATKEPTEQEAEDAASAGLCS